MLARMVVTLSAERQVFNQPRFWLQVQNSANKVEKKKKKKTKSKMKN